MRADDTRSFGAMREPLDEPKENLVLPPGSVLIPSENVGVVAVVGSALVVTLYDPGRACGGLCHFIRPLPPIAEKASPLYGLPACVALINGLVSQGATLSRLRAGLYGGAWPENASAALRQIARGNAAVAFDVLKRKGIPVVDTDLGGQRARKILYRPQSDEIVIFKTDKVRAGDWFPEP